MKYLILLLILSGCGGHSDDKCDEKAYIIYDIDTEEEYIHTECRKQSCKITFCKGDDCPRVCNG